YVFQRNQHFVWAILLTSVIINSISILSTFYFKYLIDQIIPSNFFDNLNKLSIGFLILYIGFGLNSFLRSQLILTMGLRINKNLLIDYYNHVLNLPKNFFETRKDGEILSRFRDTDHIREAFTSITVTLLIDLIMIVFGFTILFLQNKILFCIVLLFIPVYYLIMYLFKKPFEKYNRKEMEMNSRLSSKFIEGIHGIDTLKSYTNEKKFLSKIEKDFNSFLKQVYKLGFFTNLQMSIKDFMHLFTTLVILWIGSIEVMKNNMTLGELITFNALVVYFFGPIERLIEIQHTLQSAIVATRRVLEILDLNTEKSNEKKEITVLEKIKKIKFSAVNFQYGHREKILSDITFSVYENQSLALVGESGSGKSTISKLLLKYYNPTSGVIKFNNSSLENYTFKDIRSKIGYVSQNPFLFNGTIKDNLLLNNKTLVKDEDLIHACKMAECWDFIKSMPNVFDTIIEGNGINLSGGQAQRIVLARAILKNPDVLILDEPTSSLDTTVSNKIKNNLKTINCIKIIITHDINLSQDCDDILVFSKGKILNQGSHNHLLNESEKYREFWKNKIN
ncbi:TPA: peptidase domain-containing ABC transporter, partial [Staphylococcus aureus]